MLPIPQIPQQEQKELKFPTAAKQLDCFTGADGENFELWIRRVERLAIDWKWTAEQQRLVITNKLSGRALYWLDGHLDPIKLANLETLKLELKNRFGNLEGDAVIRHKLRQRRFKPSEETLNDYLLDIITLFSRLSNKVEETEIINSMIDGLPNTIKFYFEARRFAYETLAQFELELRFYYSANQNFREIEERKKKRHGEHTSSLPFSPLSKLRGQGPCRIAASLPWSCSVATVQGSTY